MISGDEEAGLAFAGATDRTDVPGPHVVIDIGGGSTEFVTLEGGRSFDIGSVRLTDRVLKDRPSPAEQVAAARAMVAEMFLPVSPFSGSVIGVAGTWTSLARIKHGQDTAVDPLTRPSCRWEDIRGLVERLGGPHRGADRSPAGPRSCESAGDPGRGCRCRGGRRRGWQPRRSRSPSTTCSMGSWQACCDSLSRETRPGAGMVYRRVLNTLPARACGFESHPGHRYCRPRAGAAASMASAAASRRKASTKEQGEFVAVPLMVDGSRGRGEIINEGTEVIWLRVPLMGWVGRGAGLGGSPPVLMP